jgi:7-keto-8-aminopelargonate synthetase-like enzyme
MSYPYSSAPSPLPAPCIIDSGILVQKEDMKRLLSDLGQVRYLHLQDDRVVSEGEGYVLEVFCDSQHSTLVANHALYLNVCSFDYLELRQSTEQGCQFDLVQDNRRLRLTPLSNPLREEGRSINVAALEAMVTEVLSASLDAQMDADNDHLY